jgi:hypothetical protein
MTGDVDVESIPQRLKTIHDEESYETADGKTLTLVTEILDVTHESNRAAGFFSRDYVLNRSFRRQVVETTTTEEAPFWITSYKDRTFLIVSAPSVARGVKKLLTNAVANTLAEALYDQVGQIVEVKIPHETLKVLHESNPKATSLIWFDQVDLPGVSKLCLAGSGLADTHLYNEYLQHGTLWYVVFKAQKRGIVVGITRSCVVTLFSKSSTTDFIEYIVEDLLPLID